MITDEIRADLLMAADEEYRLFQCKLMPTVSPDAVIGVRTPTLRKMAKALAKDPRVGEFLRDLPHASYDERNLHGFILSETKDYSEAVRQVDAFLPYVDNWATCDLLSPKAFRPNRDRLEHDVCRWMASPALYTARFGIEMAMTHYLDEDFSPVWLERVAAIQREEYYLRMMQAWYFATALAKQWDAAIPVIESGQLSPWVHNKTIQKATESYRISEERKTYLRSLRTRA